MKKTTKALALALCAVLLVVGTALTTVAYLTSKDNVVNAFTVGKVNIKLDETDVDEYGKEDGDTRVKANEYKLVPACTYTKDPMVTVLADSEECYVRMIVTIKDLGDVKNAFGTVNVNGNDYFLPQNFVQGWDSTKWVSTNVIKEENKRLHMNSVTTQQ